MLNWWNLVLNKIVSKRKLLKSHISSTELPFYVAFHFASGYFLSLSSSMSSVFRVVGYIYRGFQIWAVFDVGRKKSVDMCDRLHMSPHWWRDLLGDGCRFWSSLLRWCWFLIDCTVSGIGVPHCWLGQAGRLWRRNLILTWRDIGVWHRAVGSSHCKGWNRGFQVSRELEFFVFKGAGYFDTTLLSFWNCQSW